MGRTENKRPSRGSTKEYVNNEEYFVKSYLEQYFNWDTSE
jgi:hypothetical protein